MNNGKPTMFQIMCETKPIADVYEWYSMLNNEVRILLNGHLRGQLGASMKIDELHTSGITSETIGSISFKVNINSKSYSVLVFKNGKIKISGGFPNKLLQCRNSSNMMKYINHIVDHIQKMINSNIDDIKISCLNGQFITKTFVDVKELDNFIRNKSDKFHMIKLPDFDIPGRRGAFKLYLHKGKKTHSALDIKGKAQVFATTSFDELFYIFTIFS